MSNESTKIVGVIPAHMASGRFPGKILLDLFGLPMVEHVRRRALMSKYVDKVVVATPDLKIQKIRVKMYNVHCYVEISFRLLCYRSILFYCFTVRKVRHVIFL